MEMVSGTFPHGCRMQSAPFERTHVGDRDGKGEGDDASVRRERRPVASEILRKDRVLTLDATRIGLRVMVVIAGDG